MPAAALAIDPLVAVVLVTLVISEQIRGDVQNA
jgi:hypothetical protein